MTIVRAHLLSDLRREVIMTTVRSSFQNDRWLAHWSKLTRHEFSQLELRHRLRHDQCWYEEPL